jgi:hypothetical protein
MGDHPSGEQMNMVMCRAAIVSPGWEVRSAVAALAMLFELQQKEMRW